MIAASQLAVSELCRNLCSWLAYQSDESGAFEIIVRPFPNVNAGRTQVSTNGGALPRWARNGRELFYLDSRGRLTSVRVQPSVNNTLAHGRPDAVLEQSPFGSGYDVGPDGRFLMIKAPVQSGSERLRVNVVLNWAEELTKLARPGNNAARNSTTCSTGSPSPNARRRIVAQHFATTRYLSRLGSGQC